MEMDEDIGAGTQHAFRVIDIYLDVQSARGMVDGVGIAHDVSLNLFVGIGGLCERRSVAVMNRGGVDFWDRYIDTQPIHRIQMEEFSRVVGAGTGIDEVADVGV